MFCVYEISKSGWSAKKIPSFRLPLQQKGLKKWQNELSGFGKINNPDWSSFTKKNEGFSMKENVRNPWK